jgi:TetR/AcrR family transcriptional regulator, transcriptional repressor for nem operon
VLDWAGVGPRDGRTAEHILDIAEHLVQTRGFNAFSYADVSKALGIRKASLHHHFVTKAELGAALLARYRRNFADALRRIEGAGPGAMARLQAYVALYGRVLRRNRMCLCGMLASDLATLPRPMREGVAAFFAENEAWLARVLEEGRRQGEIRFDGGAASLASLFVSSLEGGMLLARGRGRAQPFDAVARRLLDGVRQPRSKARRPARSVRTRGRLSGPPAVT